MNATTNFWGRKSKAGDCRESITSGSFSILENHKLKRIIDLYKALFKISRCLSKIQYNKIILCKIHCDGKKGKKECRFIRRKA